LRRERSDELLGGSEANSCTPLPSSGSDTNCNNVDDDCDGSVDEGYTPLTTSCGRGACAAQGVTSCSGGQISDSCQEGTPAVGDASCDNVDDDCDGSVDEDYAPQQTICGVGACRTTGAIACQGGQTSNTCSPLQPTGTDDDCDGIDDDCDGSSDEAFVARCSGDAIVTCAGGGEHQQSCSDGDSCNGSETCTAAHCAAGTPIDTDDGNPCTADSCSEGGAILHTPLDLGSSCGPGKACDGQGVCLTKPIITTQPSSVSVSPGGSAVFAVSASGALLGYQWRRLGQAIAGATSSTFTLPNVTSSDNGAELTVAVTNPAGTVVSSTAKLTVTDALGPVLTIDGDVERTATSDVILLTGTALDDGQPAVSLVATSNRFPGELAGIIDIGSGAFRLEVPVSPGANALTLVAKDAAGNVTQKSVVIQLELSRLPRVTLTEPHNGLETDAETVDVRGYVRSSLPPEQIRLVLGTTILFPSGTNGEYGFAFEDVRLNPGSNLLTVRAETPDGTVTAMAAVLRREAGVVSDLAPVIAVIGGASEQFVKSSSLPIKGTVTAQRCTTAVTVNGAAAELKGSGSEVSFTTTLTLPSGDQPVDVAIRATDCDGRIGALDYKVRHDDVAPVIQIDLPAAPAVFTATTTPFVVAGRIAESNLATVTSNQQSLGVLPTGPGAYDFTFAVPLSRGEDEEVTIEAVDLAGNQASYKLLLHLDASFEIEVLSPRAGALISTLDDPFKLDVLARVSGVPANHTMNVRVDAGGIQPLARAGSSFQGSLSLRNTTADHRLTFAVINGSGTSVSEKTVSFRVEDADTIPLRAELRTPAGGATNIEANEPISIELNRPIADARKLKIEVKETVHGQRYKQYRPGASVGEFTNLEMEAVDRDQATVPGGTSYLPGDRLFVFYPARDYGYGGQVSVRVLYDQTELLRSQFAVRAMPTLIAGFVADQFANSVSGIDLRLDEAAVTATTNSEGTFSFGVGKVDAAIPAGRHLLVINPGLRNRNYGTIQRWVNTQPGRMRDLGVIALPLLDPSEPFRRIASHQASALLRGGDVELDLSQSVLAFPDGANEGDVHTSYYFGPTVGYPAVTNASPMLTYGLQPMGIEVSGPFDVNFALPTPDGINYIEALGAYVLLIGLDPNALELVPIGVGRVDHAQRRIRSARPLEARRLDFIGMSPLLDPGLQSLLAHFADGKIDLNQVMIALEKQQ
jgi:hypothetical protein